MRAGAAALAMATALTLAGPRAARAGGSELEVYTDGIEEPGGLGLDLLASMAPSGSRAGSGPEETDAAHTFSLVSELEYGVRPDLEADLYLLGSRTAQGAWRGGGAKLQLRYVHPRRPPSRWFWGAAVEVARLARRGSEGGTTLEVRPVAGWRGGRWLVAVNPTVEFSLDGGPHRGEAEPSAKVSFAAAKGLRLGLEHYAELGGLGELDRRGDQTHLLFAVVDATTGRTAINVGVGRGLTGASPGWVVKTLLELDLD